MTHRKYHHLLKIYVPKVPHLYQVLSIMIELKRNLTLIFLLLMRARYKFRGKSSPPQNDSSIPCPPKKPFTWRAPKTNSVELGTFLSTVEKELLINIKRNYVKDNLAKIFKNLEKRYTF